MFTPAQRIFQQQVLDAHNAHRTHHCVPDLELDDEISVSAQAYAEKLADMKKMVHSGAKHVGENLYEMSSLDTLKDVDGVEATNTWYNENRDYDFDNPGFSPNTGHFTQVVWKGSKKLGVGFAFTKDNLNVFVVAQYSPPGNDLNSFDQNVFPAKCELE